jgi:Phage tail protein
MLRLELDGGPVLDLDATELLRITEVDWGYPEIREVSDPRPQADGTIDRTAHFGARVVTLTGKLAIDWQSAGRRQQAMNALAPFLRPGARPWLYSRFDDGRVRRILLRADQFSRPQVANVQDVSLSFKSPTGVLEDENEQQVRVVPEVTSLGREYDLVFDRVYPFGLGTGVLATNAGPVSADWVARIFGPCRAPAIVNVSTGETVSLAGLSLAAGQFVEVDSRAHTVLADGRPDSSRWNTVDFVATTWWQLPPGTSTLRFRVGWWETPAQMLFFWRHTHLL